LWQPTKKKDKEKPEESAIAILREHKQKHSAKVVWQKKLGVGECVTGWQRNLRTVGSYREIKKI